MENEDELDDRVSLHEFMVWGLLRYWHHDAISSTNSCSKPFAISRTIADAFELSNNRPNSTSNVSAIGYPDVYSYTLANRYTNTAAIFNAYRIAFSGTFGATFLAPDHSTHATSDTRIEVGCPRRRR